MNNKTGTLYALKLGLMFLAHGEASGVHEAPEIWVHEHFSGKRLRAPRFSQVFIGPKISRILKNRYTSYMASTWTWIFQAQIWKQVKRQVERGKGRRH